MVEGLGGNKSGDLYATVVPDSDESLLRSAPVQQMARRGYRMLRRGQSVDVTEGGKVQVSVSPISADEIAAALDEIG